MKGIQLVIGYVCSMQAKIPASLINHQVGLEWLGNHLITIIPVEPAIALHRIGSGPVDPFIDRFLTVIIVSGAVPVLEWHCKPDSRQ